jgi:hypothetical protein
MPRRAKVMVASMVLGSEVGGILKTIAAGEPEVTRLSARTGPSRSNRALNAESIEIHLPHQRLGQNPQIAETNRIGTGALHMNLPANQCSAAQFKLRHELQVTGRRRRNNGHNGHLKAQLPI